MAEGIGNHLPKPFSGLRVLDLSSVLAGPHATRMMVGLGAEVVKVESNSRPDPSRSFGRAVCIDDFGGFFLQQHVGKRFLGLNWTTNEGAAILRRVTRHFDVVVDDCRPGVLDELGLGYADLSQGLPLIQCSITPFGLTGELARRPGDGLAAEAMSSVLDVTGYPDSGPVPMGFMFGDFTAGSYALASICAAIVGRARWGQGRHIDVAALDSTFAIHDSSLPEFNWTRGAIVRSRPGSDREVIVPYGIFPGRDGFIAIVATSNSAFAHLATVMGVPEWGAVEQYFTQAGRARDHKYIRDTIISWVESFPSVWEAEALLATSGVIAAVVRDIPGVLTEPILEERSMLVGLLGGVDNAKTLNTPFHFSLAESGLAGLSTPGKVGRDSLAVMCECGFSTDEITKLLEANILSSA
jgi:crotonobetainyl-CoA:carnitine CoA-transferase CaiB-like acyl-CoA transferase